MTLLRKLYKISRALLMIDYKNECRYYPTCSAYSEACFKHYPIPIAVGKTAWRLLRCNPWNTHMGVDLPYVHYKEESQL